MLKLQNNDTNYNVKSFNIKLLQTFYYAKSIISNVCEKHLKIIIIFYLYKLFRNFLLKYLRFNIALPSS